MIRPMPPRLTRRGSGATNPFLICPSPIRPACRQAGARIAGTDGPVCSNPAPPSLKIRQISLDAPSPLVVASPSTSAYA